MKKLIRFVLYLAGLAILSVGVVLNTKTGLGVSAINSVPFVISQLSGYTLGVMTVVVYMVHILIQVILLKKFTIQMLLQVPFSVLFGAYVNLFNDSLDFMAEGIVWQILLLLVAVVLTSLGAYLSVAMNIVPNAPDAMAKTVGEKLGKDYGYGKNVVDIICVIISCAIGLIFSGRIIGIGIGSVAAALLIGRGIKLWGKVLHGPVERISKW